MNTLCWYCGKSCRGGCSWSKEFKPVKDWEAIKKDGSYCVILCPEFERNSYGFGLYRTAEEYIDHLERVNAHRAKEIRRLKNTLGSVVWESTHYGEY